MKLEKERDNMIDGLLRSYEIYIHSFISAKE